MFFGHGNGNGFNVMSDTLDILDDNLFTSR